MEAWRVAVSSFLNCGDADTVLGVQATSSSSESGQTENVEIKEEVNYDGTFIVTMI